MAEPKENEEINEELSSEEMKSVSGGISDEPAFRKLSKVDSKYAISDEPAFSPKAEGSGSVAASYGDAFKSTQGSGSGLADAWR